MCSLAPKENCHSAFSEKKKQEQAKEPFPTICRATIESCLWASTSLRPCISSNRVFAAHSSFFGQLFGVIPDSVTYFRNISQHG
jgi:hypothetical protein